MTPSKRNLRDAEKVNQLLNSPSGGSADGFSPEDGKQKSPARRKARKHPSHLDADGLSSQTGRLST